MPSRDGAAARRWRCNGPKLIWFAAQRGWLIPRPARRCGRCHTRPATCSRSYRGFKASGYSRQHGKRHQRGGEAGETEHCADSRRRSANRHVVELAHRRPRVRDSSRDADGRKDGPEHKGFCETGRTRRCAPQLRHRPGKRLVRQLRGGSSAQSVHSAVRRRTPAARLAPASVLSCCSSIWFPPCSSEYEGSVAATACGRMEAS